MGRKERRGGAFWLCEKWLSVYGACLKHRGLPCVVGRLLSSGDDDAPDPALSVQNNARWQREGSGGPELFRGELLEEKAAAAGLQREPSLLLLRAGISVLGHVCDAEVAMYLDWA